MRRSTSAAARAPGVEHHPRRRVRTGPGELAARLADEPRGRASPLISLERQQFLVPDREGLPPLGAYAQLVVDRRRTRRVGYTEASPRLQAPVPPLPGGPGLPAASSAWCSAMWCSRTSAGRWPPAPQHITFGDPDFFNGPGHAMPHRRGAARANGRALSYDVTIKVEHLLKHRDLLPVLKAHRLRVRHQRGGIARRRGAGKARQGPHARRFSWKRSRSTRAAGLPLAPDLHPVHTRGPRARATATSCATLAELDLVDAGGADPTGHPPADSRRLAAAGTARSARDDRALRPARPVSTPGATRIPRWTRCARAFRRSIKREEQRARRRAPRSSARSGTSPAPASSRTSRCLRARRSRI